MSHFNQFKKMFIAHVKMTYREKQAWFWGIFFPIILMVLFMFIFAGSDNVEFKAKIAIVNENPNESAEMLLQQIQQIPVFEIETGQSVSRELAEEWVKDKKVDAMIILPESTNTKAVLLTVNKENEVGATAQAVSGILNNFLQHANLVAVGAMPTYELQMDTISSGSQQLKYTDFLLTGMIALAIAQSGLFGMVDLVDMRRKGLLKRLRMTPARMDLYGLSDMTMRMIFSIIQLVLLSFIGILGFGAAVHINLMSLIVIFVIGALSFNALGFLISSFSKTIESYMGVANIASFMMMFLSGIFFPIEMMPSWLQSVSQVLPLTYFADGIRNSMVYAVGISSSAIWSGVGILTLWGAVAYFLGTWLYKVRSIGADR